MFLYTLKKHSWNKTVIPNKCALINIKIKLKRIDSTLDYKISFPQQLG